MNNVLSPEDRIYIAGHRGMVGSAIARRLKSEGFHHLVERSHAELDLTDQQAVRRFFETEKIDYVVLAAAKVGGILANNTYPAEFIYRNLMIASTVIHEAYRQGIRRLLFLGSSCIYPKSAPQPMAEDVLMTGPLEATNEPYAVAKIAGIKLCESYNRQYGMRYRSVMPTNLYGANDMYDLENSHVLPALIRKFHIAGLAAEKDDAGLRKNEERYGKIPEDVRSYLGWRTEGGFEPGSVPKVVLWGTGAPRREFLHVDDLAAACVHIMKLDDETYSRHTQPMLSHINIGAGEDIAIGRLAEMVKKIVGFEGETVWDRTKPDGAMRKLLDVSLLHRLGWRPEIPLKEGIRRTYDDYLSELTRS